MHALIRLVVTVSIMALPSVTWARQHGLSESDRNKVVCVPKRTVYGTIADGQVCRTGAQWAAAVEAKKRKPAATDFADQAQRGAYLARRGNQQFGSRPAAKPF